MSAIWALLSLPSDATRGDLIEIFLLLLVAGIMFGWFLCESRRRIRYHHRLRQEAEARLAALDAGRKDLN